MEDSGHPLFICRNCRNPIALRVDLLSKDYIAKSGQAYLFSQAMNVIVGQQEDKRLITGRYSVSDVFCSNCGELLGWKYVRAYDPKNTFKENKFILEKLKIAEEHN